MLQKRGHWPKLIGERIEALEMWIWRRMEKISWMDKVTNEDVLKKVNESKNMLNHVIQQRKRKWIGHVLRHAWRISARNFWRKNEGKTNKRKEKNICSTIWLMGMIMPLRRGRLRTDRCGEDSIPVKMVVKDLLSADNQRREGGGNVLLCYHDRV